MDTIKAKIGHLTKKHAPGMIALRRKLHQHPETGLEEFQTQKTIAAKLKETGCKVNTRIWKTAVVGLLQGKHKGKTVGIRSDMDALPVTEKTGYSFASRNKGKMHACGHDVHMSIVWGAAKILSGLRHQLHGNIKFIYQPSEEITPGGAKFLIRKGVLKNPKVDMVFGLHVDTTMPVGKIGFYDGAMMAEADDFDIEIIGRSGHAARPHETVDPIMVAANVVTALQNISSRQVDPLNPVVVTIGAIHGGTTFNVIPESVAIKGTARTLEKKLTRDIPGMIEKIIAGVCKTYGARYRFDFRKGYPITVNDKRVNDIYRAAAKELYGKRSIVELTEPAMGGEDFSYFTQAVPAAMMRLGVMNKKIGADKPWHSSEFKIDERRYPLGRRFWLWLFGGF
ncbi:MAG: M20 family metallopeptidase [candidate division Zixibacteria bacterium]